ncbi:phosphoglycerate dehydrogenase [Ferdinandcohnia sp. Marseille-Q9671]
METILITTSSFGVGRPEIFDQFIERGLHFVINPFKRKLTEDELLELIKKYNPIGLIAGTEPITRKVLSNATNLKSISRCGVGKDNVDIAYAESKGISVTITPNAPTPAVKELTIGLMFDGIRKIGQSDRSIRNGVWVKKQGKLLSHQTVGIVGLGKIGKEVAEFSSIFGCRVLGYDVVDEGLDFIEYVTLEKLFADSDIISLHVPNLEETANMINRTSLSMMKKDVLLINAARGELVNEEDLYEWLIDNPSAYACLDTFKVEPYHGKLRELDNITLTTHIGSNAKESRAIMEQESVENLLKNLY